MRDYQITEEEMREVLAANLSYLRKSKRWRLSQKTLAKILHVPRKAIMNYESGKVLPPTYSLTVWHFISAVLWKNF